MPWSYSLRLIYVFKAARVRRDLWATPVLISVAAWFGLMALWFLPFASKFLPGSWTDTLFSVMNFSLVSKVLASTVEFISFRVFRVFRLLAAPAWYPPIYGLCKESYLLPYGYVFRISSSLFLKFLSKVWVYSFTFIGTEKSFTSIHFCGECGLQMGLVYNS